MNVLTVMREAGERLRKAGIEEYRLEAGLFMSKVLNRDRYEIMAGGIDELNEGQKQIFDSMIERRVRHEPAAYIIGHREFMGLDFIVRPGILIPRLDTEALAESAIECIKENGLGTLAEVGVGSGCISVSIAKYTNINCFGTDISQTAVDTARENAVLNMTEDRTKFFLGNIFDGLPLQKYDIIVSNPPYIRTNEINGLMEDVREFEPHSALNGGDDGLDFYREIASKGSLLLNQNGCIFFEIGYDQSADVAYILEKNGFENIRIIKDLSGLDRVVAASKEDIDV